MNDQVRHILNQTLGENLEISPMPPGRSGARLWSVEQGDNRWVVRQAGPQGSTPAEAERMQRCMRLAAERGLAPQLVYAQDGLMVMERVTGSALNRGTPRETDPLGRLATTLRHLHQGPAFPPGPPLLFMFRDLESHLEQLPPLLGHTLEETSPQLAALGEPAPCHLDLNPSNILASPDHIYLVDWELASQNEPYLDLAQLGVWVCRDAGERAQLLHKYLGQAPDERQRQRMHFARLQALCFYAAAFHLVTHMQGRKLLQNGPDLDGVFQEMARTGLSFHPESMAHALILELQRELSP